MATAVAGIDPLTVLTAASRTGYRAVACNIAFSDLRRLRVAEFDGPPVAHDLAEAEARAVAQFLSAQLAQAERAA